jgi:hypothetical protein
VPDVDQPMGLETEAPLASKLGLMTVEELACTVAGATVPKARAETTTAARSGRDTAWLDGLGTFMHSLHAATEVAVKCLAAAQQSSHNNGLMLTMEEYATPGPLTDLHGIADSAFAGLDLDPVGICQPVHSLIIQPTEATALGLGAERLAENQLRPAAAIVTALLALDPAPLVVAREPGRRVVGTCRHFAVLSCALLRRAGIPSRVRCGFAMYFQPGQALDHWITEYWDGEEPGWIRVDSEILGQSVVAHPERLEPGQFFSGGEAWSAYRRGEVDGSIFGVYGTENWGPAEIRGNAVKDLASLNRVEMLPWDEWGRMTEAYAFKTGEDYDELLDELAVICARDDLCAISQLYAREELRLPDGMVI